MYTRKSPRSGQEVDLPETPDPAGVRATRACGTKKKRYPNEKVFCEFLPGASAPSFDCKYQCRP